jgi:hypothetical protein
VRRLVLSEELAPRVGKHQWPRRVPFPKGEKMNLRQTMFKLQTALNRSGRRVKINQIQTWSEAKNKMTTKYVVSEDGDVIIASYQTAVVVKALADIYNGGGM